MGTRLFIDSHFLDDVEHDMGFVRHIYTHLKIHKVPLDFTFVFSLRQFGLFQTYFTYFRELFFLLSLSLQNNIFIKLCELFASVVLVRNNIFPHTFSLFLYAHTFNDPLKDYFPSFARKFLTRHLVRYSDKIFFFHHLKTTTEKFLSFLPIFSPMLHFYLNILFCSCTFIIN